MAKASDYLSAVERCKLRAKHATDEETRCAWLNLVESYDNLLQLEEIETGSALIGGKFFGSSRLDVK